MSRVESVSTCGLFWARLGRARQGWAGSFTFLVVEGFSLGRLVKAECIYMSEGAFPSALRATCHLHQVSRDVMDVF